MGGKHKPDGGKSEVKIKAKHAACPVCKGRSYTVPAGTRCSGCNRRRNTNTCPGCGGLPERVEGKECSDCGTPAGKNPEYRHPPRSYGTVKMDGLL